MRKGTSGCQRKESKGEEEEEGEAVRNGKGVPNWEKGEAGGRKKDKGKVGMKRAKGGGEGVGGRD